MFISNGIKQLKLLFECLGSFVALRVLISDVQNCKNHSRSITSGFSSIFMLFIYAYQKLYDDSKGRFVTYPAAFIVCQNRSFLYCFMK